MTKYFLNSALITAEGTYTYRRLAVEEAWAWAYSGPEPVSSIGCAETAAALTTIMGRLVPANRRTVSLAVGDEALVFRIVLPLGSPRIDPQDKGHLGDLLRTGNAELGLLRRVE